MDERRHAFARKVGVARAGRVRAALTAPAPGEGRAVLWAFGCFFSLLCSYYTIRPLRDEMGIAGGVEHLHWVFSGTFVVMLAVTPAFGWVTRHYPPRRFLPAVYGFFILNLILFFGLLEWGGGTPWTARAFFIWASVFNLFVVSVFWSLMADIFDNDQAKRLFGVIAAGGTLGALAGPALAGVLALHLGPASLLLVSAALLGGTVVCTLRLIAWRASARRRPDEGIGDAPGVASGTALGGSVWAGIRLVARSPYLSGICLFILLVSTLATFLYFQQAQIVRDRFPDPSQRTAFFAGLDLAVNGLTLTTQVLLTGRIVSRWGLDWALAIVPLAIGAGFALLALAPALGVVAGVQVVRRAGEYALTRPGREMLYTVLSREEKYKAKNVVDTLVYRGGDAVSAWAFAGLQALGLTAGGIALLAVPLSAAWAYSGFRLGRRRERLAVRLGEDRVQGGDA